jgi:hypothetical protein
MPSKKASTSAFSRGCAEVAGSTSLADVGVAGGGLTGLVGSGLVGTWALQKRKAAMHAAKRAVARIIFIPNPPERKRTALLNGISLYQTKDFDKAPESWRGGGRQDDPWQPSRRQGGFGNSQVGLPPEFSGGVGARRPEKGGYRAGGPNPEEVHGDVHLALTHHCAWPKLNGVWASVLNAAQRMGRQGRKQLLPMDGQKTSVTNVAPSLSCE